MVNNVAWFIYSFILTDDKQQCPIWLSSYRLFKISGDYVYTERKFIAEKNMGLFHHFPESALQERFKVFIQKLYDIARTTAHTQKETLLDLLLNAKHSDIQDYLSNLEGTYLNSLISIISYEAFRLGLDKSTTHDILDVLKLNKNEKYNGITCYSEIMFSNELKIEEIPMDFISHSISDTFDSNKTLENQLELIDKFDSDPTEYLANKLVADHILQYSLEKFGLISYAPPSNRTSEIIQIFASDNFIQASFEDKCKLVDDFSGKLSNMGADIWLEHHLCSFALNYLRSAVVTNKGFQDALDIATQLLRVASIKTKNECEKSTFIEQAIQIILLPFPNKFMEVFGRTASKETIDSLILPEFNDNELILLKSKLFNSDYLKASSRGIALKRVLAAHGITDFSYTYKPEKSPYLDALCSHPEEFSQSEIPLIAKATSQDHSFLAFNYLKQYLSSDTKIISAAFNAIVVILPTLYKYEIDRLNKLIVNNNLEEEFVDEILKHNLLDDCKLLQELSSLHPRLSRYYQKIKNPDVRSMLFSSSLNL